MVDMKFALLSLFVVLGAKQLVAAQEKPWYCGERDCPLFTTEPKGSYTIRTYQETSWLATSVISDKTEAKRSQKMGMFWRMFPYFNRKNTDNVKVKMSVPGLTKVEKRQDGRYNITLMFYVSIPNAPFPTAKSVELITRPAGEVYVKEFPMYTMPGNDLIESKAKDLTNEIADSNSFNNNIYYSASYQYPFSTTLKQYEVWMDKRASV